jgi:eukaryotic-like serine/threonine-protein kinase
MTATSAALDLLVAQVVDEFHEALKRGETPDVEEYAARHPDAAAVLRNVLATFQLLDGTSPSFSPQRSADGQDGSSAAPLSGTLGDFRILREIGRGGMGVVYEAEPISLGRIVALKVLPFAATMDARGLQRFQNEARAAASLHHPHIVPVHAVGCDRGVHYYAMQLIKGQSLDVVLRELRGLRASRKSEQLRAPGGTAPSQARDVAPTIDRLPAHDPATLQDVQPQASTLAMLDPKEQVRRIVELVIQAAQAIEYAHELGIVHRDIKPANMLMDTCGNLWITDFGLAQIGADTRMTLTGDMVGTLRYMSPEQAEGRRAILDQRADVYSLGVTLYELLTLEPAVRGHSREAILRGLIFDEPTPPRQLNRAIPKDLETIILKAIAKKPAERYATMAALAADMRALLDHAPIRAQRPMLRARFGLWCRQIERIRDAGSFMFFLSLVLFAWCAVCIVVLATGVLQTPDPRGLIIHCVRCGVYYIVMMWLARNALRRKAWALWTGAVLTLPAVAICIWAAVTPDWPEQLGLGDVYPNDATSRFVMAEFNALMALLFGWQLAIIIIGLVAYYANWERYREAKKTF